MQIIYLVKLPRKRLCCFLLCLSFLNSSWLYFVWQFLFYCGKKNGLTDKGFWDPNLLIAVCMASLCFLDWWVAWHWLWAKDGLSHINYTVASKHCTLAHVNCVKKLLVNLPLCPKVSLHSCMSVETCGLFFFVWPPPDGEVSSSFGFAVDKTVHLALQDRLPMIVADMVAVKKNAALQSRCSNQKTKGAEWWTCLVLCVTHNDRVWLKCGVLEEGERVLLLFAFSPLF